MNKFCGVFNVINELSVSGLNVKKGSWFLDLEIYDSILLSPVLSWDVIPSCLCQHHGIIAFPSLHGYHVLTGWQSSNSQTEMSIHTFPPQWSIPCSVSLSFSLLYSLSVFPPQASHEAHSEKLTTPTPFSLLSLLIVLCLLLYIYFPIPSFLSEVHLDSPSGHMHHQRSALVKAINYLKILL